MSELLLKFEVRFNGNQISSFSSPQGPLFSRWLPNGEADAIELAVDDPDFELKVWFKRKGRVEGSFIRYSKDEGKFDEKVMAKQAILDAGPLFGFVIVRNIKKRNLNIIQEQRVGHKEYIKFGKRVVKTIQPPISILIQVLRIYFGQYWIKELEPWDSRKMSIGYYCRNQLRLHFSVDSGKTWHHFQPSEQNVVLFTLPELFDQEFSQYITEKDYEKIHDFLGRDPNFSAIILANAHQLFDQYSFRLAIVEAVTSLEIAVHEYIRLKIKISDTLVDRIQSFVSLSLKTKMIVISSINEKIMVEDLELAVEAIDLRNKILHEGYEPIMNASNISVYKSLNKVIAILSEMPIYKFPQIIPGNKLFSE